MAMRWNIQTPSAELAMRSNALGESMRRNRLQEQYQVQDRATAAEDRGLRLEDRQRGIDRLSQQQKEDILGKAARAYQVAASEQDPARRNAIIGGFRSDMESVYGPESVADFSPEWVDAEYDALRPRMQTDQGDLQLKKVYDPATGQITYARERDAIGAQAPPPAAGASTTINMPAAAGEGEKTFGRGVAEDFRTLQGARGKANATLDLLRRAEQLAGEVETLGPAAPALQAFKRGAGSLVDLEAMGITDDTAAAEALQAVSTQALLQQAESMAGVLSDSDIALLRQAAPRLSQTREGLAKLIETQRRIAGKAAATARHMGKWMQDRPAADRFTPAYYAALGDFQEANPLFTPDEVQAFRDPGVSTAQAAPRPQGGGGRLPGTGKSIAEKYGISEEDGLLAAYAARSSGLSIEEIIEQGRREGRF